MALLSELEFAGPAAVSIADWSSSKRQRLSGLQIPCAAIGLTLAFVDVVSIVLASLLSVGGHPLLISETQWNLDFHVGAGVAAALLYLLIGRSIGFYQFADIFSLRRNTSRISGRWIRKCEANSLNAGRPRSRRESCHPRPLARIIAQIAALPVENRLGVTSALRAKNETDIHGCMVFDQPDPVSAAALHRRYHYNIVNHALSSYTTRPVKTGAFHFSQKNGVGMEFAW